LQLVVAEALPRVAQRAAFVDRIPDLKHVSKHTNPDDLVDQPAQARGENRKYRQERSKLKAES